MVLRWASHEIRDNEIAKGGEDLSHSHQIFLASVNTLVVACIISWGRLLNAFAISDSLGPLYFIIIRLFRDIFVWIYVFVIFAVSFQLGFISITQQAGANPVTGYPDGTFPVAFFTIIGEYSYAADILKDTPLGVALLAVYALLAQILLVNLLIAMMGDTYSNVSDNSAEEWKFYRLELMMENQSTSFHPPPTNLLIIPIELILEYTLNAGKVFKEGNRYVSIKKKHINKITKIWEWNQAEKKGRKYTKIKIKKKGMKGRKIMNNKPKNKQ